MKPSVLITKLAAEPASLDEISWRELEELVAEIIASLGWQVSLTPPTRDGGHDVLAINANELGLDTAWAIECKRYRPDRKVGVDIVRSLYGVKHGLRIPQALLVTTSTFTRDALEFAAANTDIRLADREELLRWIADYRPPTDFAEHLESQRFQSCFVSYSHRDEDFVAHLVRRLRAERIHLFYAPEDMVAGQKLHEQITSAIEKFDRLIVVLSDNSMESRWVETELKRARRREIRSGDRVLFPVSLVPFERLRSWELFDADSGQDLANELRGYLIPDFSKWHDQAKFEAQLQALLRGLKTG